MKIRLSAQGISLNVEVQDDKAMSVYRGLAEKLLIHAGETACKPKLVIKPEKIKTPEAIEMVRGDLETFLQQKPEPLPEPIPQEQENDEELLEESAEEPAEESASQQEPNMTGKRKGYKGFLLIRCDKCGHARSFCSRQSMKQYECQECGEKIVLKDLRSLFANCECGNRSRYLTNIEDPVTEVDCVNCKAPVAVEWNAKKKCYQTISEKQ